MHIVITGLTSLIGNNIASFFAEKGHEVSIIGRDQNINLRNKKIKFKKIDWKKPEIFFNHTEQIDAFIHCAGINAKESQLNKEKAFQFNSMTTGKLAKLCTQNKVKTFIYLSTIHVYSSKPEGLITERYKANNENPYAKSKLKGEELIKRKCDNSDTKFLILRLSNIIASPLLKKTNCWELLAPNICKQIFENKYIVLNSNPSILRDFIGVNELNKFLDYYFTNLYNIESDTFNFASAKAITILELAKKIKENYGKLYNDSINISYKESDINNFQKNDFCFSTEKIKSLGHKIGHEFDNEINQLLRFCNLNF